jgi:hypothetical protein
MRVDIQRQAHRRVAEQFTHHLRMHAAQ